MYYFSSEGKTYSVNIDAKNFDHAVAIAVTTGFDLKGEKVEEVTIGN